jgi:hypothetical protein
VLADNKLALNAGWDHELLAIELQGLIALDFEIEVTGFSPAEIEIVLDEARESSPNGLAEAEDEVLLRVGGPASAVTRPGKDDRQLCAQEAQPLAHRNAALQ